MSNFNRFVSVLTILVLLGGCGGSDDRRAAYAEKADKLFEEGNYEKARLEYQNAIQIDPKSTDVHFKLGQTLERLGQWKGAMSHYLAVLKLDKDHVGAHVHSGQLYLLGNSIDKALEEAETALKLDPDSSDALALRGGIKAKSGDISGAFTDGLEGLKKDPGHINSIALISALHLAQDDPVKAVGMVDQGLEVEPGNTSLLALKAKILVTQKDIDGASKILEQIIDSDPDRIERRYQLISFYLKHDRIDLAEKALRDAIPYEKDGNKTRLSLVEFLLKYRSFEEAEKELLSLIETNPKESDFEFALASLYRLKDVNKSIGVLNKIIEKNDSDSPVGMKAKSMLATVYMTEKNIDEAGKLAAEVLSENINDEDALTVRGSIAMLNNQAGSAVEDFRTILKSNPESVKHLRLLARAHIIRDENNLAHEALKQAVKLTPGDALVRSELAEVLLRQNKHDLAIEQIQEVLSISPDNSAALETLFKLQSAKQDWKSAISTAERIKEAFPEKGEGYHLSGLAHQMNNDFEASVEDYSKALQIAPDAIQPLTQLVRGYLAEDNAEEALGRVQNVLSQNPKNHIALNMKGEILLSMKQLGEAKDVFRFAIKVKPDYRTPYLRLARVHAIEKNMDGAISSYESGLEALPDDPVLITGLASIYESVGNIDKAVGLYEKVVEQDPKSQLAANNLAMLYADRFDDKDLLKKAQELIKVLKDTETPAFLDTIGWVRFKAGDLSGAISALGDAVSKAPQEPVLQYHLGMAYFEEENTWHLANKYLTLALGSDKNFTGRKLAEEAINKINQ